MGCACVVDHYSSYGTRALLINAERLRMSRCWMPFATTAVMQTTCVFPAVQA
ncbi:hypothetical protein PISMIDRAFT_680766 [Pisolithus microcarpus 441]|uniref:Uncharacterized protein n=1 Tax=Pisolithus microcarpus 441 TaxID=765257 RepID=A0A0C9YZ47_9AGAM|nr:hypothetical protein PISMIDRAFT_680766 [Pisolithus microcarpus 441]